MDFTPEQFVEAVKAIAYKHDPASTVSNWAPAHGPGGLFNAGTVRPGMYSTIPRPVDLSRVIPMIGSLMQNEVYEILTGQTATEGTRAADICSEGPMAGKLKVCRQVIGFGEMKIDTSVERITKFGRRLNYGDLDRNFFNLEAVNNPMIPDVLNENNVNSSTGKLLFEAALAVERSYSAVDINGVQGATTAPGGVPNAADYVIWISQYDGLNTEIRAGYVDSVTGVACPAADSIVITHNAPIASAGTNGQTFVANVVNMVRSAVSRAERVGMGDFNFALMMHPNAAFGIYDVWACNYNTDRCTGSAGNPVSQTANDVVAFRDSMINGNYLLVDGRAIPIIFSSGMQWFGSANNTFITDIFLVPLSWRGRPLLFRHFFPLNNTDATGWIEAQGPLTRPLISNNGLYAVGGRTTNGFCTKLEIISQTRLILDTPFLAGRVNDIQIPYNVSSFDPYIGMSDYRDGGQSSRFTTPLS